MADIGEKIFGLIVAVAVVALIVCVLGIVGAIFHVGSVITVVYQGEHGVGYNAFTGDQYEEIYDSGVHPIWPWTIVHKYCTAVQRTPTESLVFASSDGAKITVTTSVSYQLLPQSLGTMQTKYQGDYEERLVKPAWKTEVGAAIASKSVAYYTADRDTNEIKKIVEESLSEKLAKDGIVLDTVYVESMIPQEGISTAVDIRQQLNASNNDSSLVVGYKYGDSIGKTPNKVIVT